MWKQKILLPASDDRSDNSVAELKPKWPDIFMSRCLASTAFLKRIRFGAIHREKDSSCRYFCLHTFNFKNIIEFFSSLKKI